MPQGSTKENIAQQLSKNLSTAHILIKIFMIVFLIQRREVFLKIKLEDEIYSLVNIFYKEGTVMESCKFLIRNF